MGLDYTPATVGIEIDGATYQAVAGNILLAERMESIRALAEETDERDLLQVRHLMDEIEGCVSDALGADAVSAIFGGREGDVVWYIRVWRHILENVYSEDARGLMMESLADLTATDDAD